MVVGKEYEGEVGSVMGAIRWRGGVWGFMLVLVERKRVTAFISFKSSILMHKCRTPYLKISACD